MDFGQEPVDQRPGLVGELDEDAAAVAGLGKHAVADALAPGNSSSNPAGTRTAGRIGWDGAVEL